MPAKTKGAVHKPARPSPRKPRPALRMPDSVTLHLNYLEASLLVVGANLAMGLPHRPGSDDQDQELATTAAGIVDKLYRAEPSLKRDARRIEGELRTFLTDIVEEAGPLDDGEIDDEPEDVVLRGQEWLPTIGDAMKAGQEVVLHSGEGERDRRLRPLGAGQVGDVAVAIGWSEDVQDFAAIRLDDIDGVAVTDSRFESAPSELTEACLDRFGRRRR